MPYASAGVRELCGEAEVERRLSRALEALRPS